MNFELFASNISDKYLKEFESVVQDIDPIIENLLIDKNVRIVLANNLYDVRSKEEIQKNHKRFYEDKYGDKLLSGFKTRGIMSDTAKCVAVFADNTEIENIEAILYHELGHFLDAYDNFGNIDTLNDMFFSSDKKFVNAYKNDFIQNWDLIKNDKNPRLRHFVQNCTPDKFYQSALSESFAEIFRWSQNKKYSVLTVEPYFKDSKSVVEQLVAKRFNITNVKMM